MTQQQNYKSTIERAFEIADSGEANSIQKLSLMLSSEGYSINMITGPVLLKQLRTRMAAPRPAP